jgi:hypothetical protein
MCRCLAVVGLLVLIAQGCTKRPESYPMTAFRVDYHHWNCQQLADRSRSPQRGARRGNRAARRGQGGALEGGYRGEGKDFEEV